MLTRRAASSTGIINHAVFRGGVSDSKRGHLIRPPSSALLAREQSSDNKALRGPQLSAQKSEESSEGQSLPLDALQAMPDDVLQLIDGAVSNTLLLNESVSAASTAASGSSGGGVLKAGGNQRTESRDSEDEGPNSGKRTASETKSENDDGTKSDNGGVVECEGPDGKSENILNEDSTLNTTASFSSDDDATTTAAEERVAAANPFSKLEDDPMYSCDVKTGADATRADATGADGAPGANSGTPNSAKAAKSGEMGLLPTGVPLSPGNCGKSPGATTSATGDATTSSSAAATTPGGASASEKRMEHPNNSPSNCTATSNNESDAKLIPVKNAVPLNTVSGETPVVDESHPTGNNPLTKTTTGGLISPARLISPTNANGAGVNANGGAARRTVSLSAAAAAGPEAAGAAAAGTAADRERASPSAAAAAAAAATAPAPATSGVISGRISPGPISPRIARTASAGPRRPDPIAPPGHRVVASKNGTIRIEPVTSTASHTGGGLPGGMLHGNGNNNVNLHANGGRRREAPVLGAGGGSSRILSSRQGMMMGNAGSARYSYIARRKVHYLG